MINVISPVLIIAGIGFVIGRRMNPNTSGFSTLLVYVFAPALVFQGISTTTLSGGELGGLATTAIAVAGVMTAVGLIVARLMHFDRKLESAFVMCVVLVNAGNYGIPLNTFAFGASGEQRAIVYYVMSAIISSVIGVYFASRGELSARSALLNVLRVPITYAAILGLLVNLISAAQPMHRALWTLLPDYEQLALPGTMLRVGFVLPLPISRALQILSGASIPGMLILLGLKLAHLSLSERWRAVILASGIKLLIAPLVAVILALALGLTDITFKVAVVESSMPTAVIANALAVQFRADAEFTSAVTVMTTVLSVLTLSVLLLILGGVG